MQNKKDCTSTAISSSNAFTRRFLEKLVRRDYQPYAAMEAEARGPWSVVELSRSSRDHEDEPWAVFRSWEDPETDRPAATFHDRELALLYAAGQEVGGRRSVLGQIREEDEEDTSVLQLTLDGEQTVVGHIRIYDEDTFAAFRNLETLLWAIEPLAQVLDAAGSSIIELVGRRLMAE